VRLRQERADDVDKLAQGQGLGEHTACPVSEPRLLDRRALSPREDEERDIHRPQPLTTTPHALVQPPEVERGQGDVIGLAQGLVELLQARRTAGPAPRLGENLTATAGLNPLRGSP
jgi:hypothetical protein